MPKKYDCVVKGREYQDASGQTKCEWINVGVMMDGEKGPYLMLNRHINLAGFPNPDNRTSVLVAMFDPKDKQNAPPSSAATVRKPNAPRANSQVDEFDEGIPF